MDKIKNKILELVTSKPKHFSRIIRNDQNTWPLIATCYGNSIAEKIYNFLYSPEIKCKNGNYKKFKSIFDGYVHCGRANQCQCTADIVSKKVSLTKQSYNAETRTSITQKRKETNIKRYGVENVGQLESAKNARKILYNDKETVDKLVNQVRNTKKEKHGDANYNNPTKIKETFRKRYPIEYWCERYNNSNLQILADKEELSKLYKVYSIPELAEQFNVHIQTVYKYLNKFDLRDPFSSSEETEIVTFLRSLGISNIVRNTRKLLPSKKEIDIYLPEYSIAIEYNGVYWHHEDISHITRSYHYDKFLECRNMDIQLITIFSNFWRSNKNLVKNILINKLGLSKKKISARQCKIHIPEKNEIREFLEKNHIQGYTTSSIQYGLTYENELVALMTFGKTRLGIGSRESGYELIRYSSSQRIVGGAGKLLNHFIKLHNPSKIISYSDNEWSDGNLYVQLGFKLDKEIKPSYWYLSPKKEKLLHRFNFAKHKLIELGYDQNLTENQITKEMGLLKIWDCGKKKWTLDL